MRHEPSVGPDHLVSSRILWLCFEKITSPVVTLLYPPCLLLLYYEAWKGNFLLVSQDFVIIILYYYFKLKWHKSGHYPIRKNYCWDWRDDSLVKSTCCSYRGSGMDSLNPYDSLQASVILVPWGSDILFWSPRTPSMYVVPIHSCRQTFTHIRINKYI